MGTRIMVMKCRNCGIKCGAVDGFDPPYCCDSCNEEWHIKLEKKLRQYDEDVLSGKRNK
jgi:hypothetical protein